MAVLLAPLVAAANAVVPDGFARIRSIAGIDEYVMSSNGLSVLLKPDHSAPVLTLNVTYRVGSRNEVTGSTGATHLLEHLMFKGSEGFNDAAGNSVKQYLERAGARYNATTSLDRTNYYATVGRDSFEGYLAIEADRMRRLWLREEDRQKEMPVVRNEFERGKNDPDNTLQEEVTAAAFLASPYHHSTIGWKSDIEHVPIQKLKSFYDTYYWPNNATVTLVGDFAPAEALTLIRKYYGAYPRSPSAIPEVYTEEPEQSGARRVIVKRPAQLGSVLIAHKVPNARHADTPALDVLDAILSQGKASRLYRALVDKGLATAVFAIDPKRRDLSLHLLGASLAPGAKLEDTEQALRTAIATIQRDGVTAAEVVTAQRQLRTQRLFRRDNSAGVATELNEWIAAGDWTLYATFPQAVSHVTAADVQRVATAYLIDDLSTTGWFVPTAVP
ncbi:MAG: M16 family metallopeptidase [Steroidobacterales bacterium]